MASFLPIGRIHSAQGIKGDLYVQVFSGEAAWADQWTSLFLAERDTLQPQKTLTIESKKIHRKQQMFGFVLSVKEIKDRTEAEALKGLSVLVPEEFLASGEGETVYLREVLDFVVIDQERGPVGHVKGFESNSLQDLLVVEDHKGRTFEIPFTEPILVEIDKKAKSLHMDIPYGLLPGERI